jgi:hypothetical protein
LAGRVVLEGSKASNYLDIGSLADGVYLIRCQNGDRVHLSRVVLRR